MSSGADGRPGGGGPETPVETHAEDPSRPRCIVARIGIRVHTLAVALVAVLLGTVVASCGGGGGTSTTAELTPEEVSANLQSAGYRVGKPIHSGANEGVAQNGKLDADTYLSVDADPSGVQLYAGIYFFSNEKDAGIAAAEFAKEGDSSSTSTLEGTRLYNVSGTKAQLDGIVAAAETG